MNRRDIERELAAEIHALVLAQKRELADEADLLAAIDLVRAARERVRGDARPRWFAGVPADGRAGQPLDFDNEINDFALYRGRSNALASQVRPRVITLDDGTAAIEAIVRCDLLYEGPPHGVHGGYVAGLFDDILGASMRLIDGPSGVTGTLEVKYRKLTPLDTDLRFVAWVYHQSGRRIHARATCHAGDVLTAEAEALFVRVDMAALAEGRDDYRPRH